MKTFLNSLQGKIIAVLTIITLVFGIVAEGVLIYRNGAEAKTATETANNAAKLKLAEAQKAAAEAEAAREAANNAAKLKLAEAQKAAADAETAREIASNAGKLKLAEAQKAVAEAELQLQKSRTAKAEADVSPEMQAANLAAKQAEARKLDGEATVAQLKACAMDVSKCTPEQKCIIDGYNDVGSRYSELSTAAVERLAGDSIPFHLSRNQKCAHLRNEPQQQANEAPANAELPPKCREAWAKWQGFAHGAFATTGTNDCLMNGTANPRGTKEGAIQSLKMTCSQSRQNCELIAAK